MDINGRIVLLYILEDIKAFMDKVIEVKNLSFGYKDSLLLENVNFSVDRGDYLGIIGPNGSAKSTLLKLLLKILTPLKGEIRILNVSIERFKGWHKVGYLSQKAASFNSNFPATVEEIVGSGLYSKIGLFRHLKKQHRDLVYDSLETVGMQDYGKQLIGNLSGGQQQRVFIARLLASDPEIMILDEPTVGIDAKSEEAVYCLLARLNRERGITIIMVTHDIGAITVHANKLALMENKSLLIQKPDEAVLGGFINRLYGYGVNFSIDTPECKNCSRRQMKMRY